MRSLVSGSLEERRRVRQALATDRRWQDEFIAHIQPMCLMQRNNVLICLPGTGLVYPEPDSGIGFSHASAVILHQLKLDAILLLVAPEVHVGIEYLHLKISDINAIQYTTYYYCKTLLQCTYYEVYDTFIFMISNSNNYNMLL